MRGISKKILISLLTTLVVFITVFATTYAWVGIFTYANSDLFNMNLKVVGLDSNYYLTISSTGEKDDFGDHVANNELERQIVSNYFNRDYSESSDEFIHSSYERIKLKTVSTFIDSNNTIENFYSMSTSNKFNPTFNSAKDFYKFDLYLSVDTKEGINESTTGIKANVLLNDLENTLIGTQSSYKYINHTPFSDLPSTSEYSILKELPDDNFFNMNSKNAVRFALSIYDPININDEYNDQYPIKTIIYQGGNNKPYFDVENNEYDLGGCIEHEYNVASQELMKLFPAYVASDTYFNKYSEVLSNRYNDCELKNENALIWNRAEHLNYLGCMDGIQTKMKITVYFWFEGWDADCIRSIEEKPVTLNLSFINNVDS